MQNPSGPTPLNSDRARLRPGPCAILLVEDHDDTRRLLTLILERAGHTVHAASTMAEARALIASARTPLDVMVADLELPDGYGDVLIAEFKAAHPKGTVIVASGHGYAHDVERARAKGADAYLIKPFTLEDLERTVTQTSDCPPTPDEVTK